MVQVLVGGGQGACRSVQGRPRGFKESVLPLSKLWHAITNEALVVAEICDRICMDNCRAEPNKLGATE